jgi:hypothetical protein
MTFVSTSLQTPRETYKIQENRISHEDRGMMVSPAATSPPNDRGSWLLPSEKSLDSDRDGRRYTSSRLHRLALGLLTVRLSAI